MFGGSGGGQRRGSMSHQKSPALSIPSGSAGLLELGPRCRRHLIRAGEVFWDGLSSPVDLCLCLRPWSTLHALLSLTIFRLDGRQSESPLFATVDALIHFYPHQRTRWRGEGPWNKMHAIGSFSLQETKIFSRVVLITSFKKPL
jgi:hypothetical protein